MVQTTSLRESYGHTLVELGQENSDIVVLEADLCWSTMTHFFRNQFPERFFDCGIAEQNMVSIAAGLAASGKIPFASTFAVFIPGRCFDQVRMSVAQPRLNVKLVATHGGISVGEDGISHHAIEDLALINSLPGFNVIVPADAIETAQAVKTAASTYGPFYIRLCRPNLPLVYDENYKFELGKATTLRQGKKATIIAIGSMVSPALDAADKLRQQDIDCCVLSMPTLKPIDKTAIINAANNTGAIVTVEEHLEHGGLGSSVAQVVVKQHPVPMEFVALKDTYAESGKGAELLEKYGLSSTAIEQAVKSIIKRKQE
ncbi:MAG: transketolase family protein [Dehalococcoidales bacterium]|nr:transketolase family protein [Dehalococcoidales bacterium]